MQLIKGSNLTHKQRNHVKRAFVHRFTGEHKPDWASKPMPNGNQYQPTHKTDNDWIEDYAFYVQNNGELSTARKHQHCEPAFMADTQ